MRSISRFAAVALLAVGAAAFAQGYPNKPIKVVVPYAPGGNMEHWRPTLAKVSQILGQPLLMENRPGAGGNIGSDTVAKSPGDGYTLLIGTIGTHAINPSAYARMPYDAIKDFTPIVSLATMTNVAIVHPAMPVKTIQEFIAHAKASPGKLNFGSPGNGSSAHLTGELFNQVAGVSMQHVPYKGSAPAMLDLMAGRLDIMFDNIPLPLQHIKAGKLRGLAVTAAQRSAVLPELPTLGEAGVQGFDVSSWYGIYAPAGLPKELVARVNAAFNEALRVPEIREQLTAQGWTVTGGTPEQFGAFTQAELDRWAKVVKAANVRVE
ncbi:tripartite tricarboxylate transporter substrate binding protein [Ideonella sp. A 288]|uniref:Bug family tripartite tricarboxylate transporter substrate binding protein n=1 Tax=Ideonella sp. A 288 TaxID=1962181 RepID=UPI000B4B59B6|nr:tripartite tricarboxylate transporter substrate binding protein [Ideonella sp. A 288]